MKWAFPQLLTYLLFVNWCLHQQFLFIKGDFPILFILPMIVKSFCCSSWSPSFIGNFWRSFLQYGHQSASGKNFSFHFAEGHTKLFFCISCHFPVLWTLSCCTGFFWEFKLFIIFLTSCSQQDFSKMEASLYSF